MSDRVKTIRNASIVGVVGNSILALAKILTGLFTGSLSVLGDGFDSATDILISSVSLFATKIMNKPPDKDHPYGHGRVEILTTKIVSFIIFFAGIELATQSINRLVKKQAPEIAVVAITVSLFSIFGKLLLALHKFQTGKKVKSSLLIADAKNMRNDVVLSTCVLAGLFVGKLTGWWFADAVTALVVSLWIIKVAFSIYRESDTELMDGYRNFDDYKVVLDSVSKIRGVYNPHKVRIRTLGAMLVVDIDIEVEPTLTVVAGHKIAQKVSKKIREVLENVYDVQVHVEPCGNKEKECFGISKDDV